ncbi:MAG: hypothetical protein ACYCSN_18035 [Acidobacteriaceae bacterium]
MARDNVRQMKKFLALGKSPDARSGDVALSLDAALWLLDRSIAFGHRRLAVVRLAMAVRVGASISPEHWRYCAEAALKNEELRATFDEALRLAASRNFSVPNGTH